MNWLLRSMHLCFRRSFDDVTRSGFDFWSRGHLRMAVMHLPVKFGADVFIKSGVINIFSEIQDGGRRHLGFLGYENLAIPTC